MKRLLLMLVIPFLFISCKKDSDNDKDLKSISGKWEYQDFGRSVVLEIFPKYGGNKEHESDGDLNLYINGKKIGEGEFGYQWKSKTDFTIAPLRELNTGNMLYLQLIYELTVLSTDEILIRMPIIYDPAVEVPDILPEGKYVRVRN